ncbi:hypothetical protein BVC80_1139g18 [Macleaya cordata]|uniref:Uncharacterized protein n=1 Tax=Macleaya cordata TaxID=56857 RepID=A0A200Q2V3_MACCD|nr:hypothetical protein BVC80_1139g18 [Macleaya cordata]
MQRRFNGAIEILEYVVGTRDWKHWIVDLGVDDENRRSAELLKEAGPGMEQKSLITH